MGQHRYHELDALRAVAALGVVCAHYLGVFHAAPFGHVLAPFYRRGPLMVDFFFVLSGFVLAHAFWTPARSRQVMANVGARLARLYPLHLVTLLFVALLQWVVSSGLQWKDGLFVYPHADGYHFLLNLFLLQHSGLNNGGSFNVPSWSISTEFMVNVVFMMLIAAPRRIAVLAMAALAAVSLYGLTSDVLLSAKPVFGWFDRGIVRTFAGFFLGVGVYRLHVRWGGVSAPLVFDLVTAATLVAIGTYLASQNLASTTGDMLCAFVGFPVLVFAVVRSRWLRGWLTFKPMLHLGKISYSIYLVHYPLQLLTPVLAIVLGVNVEYESRWVFVAFVAGVIAVASITHRWIEVGGRQWMSAVLHIQPQRSMVSNA